jgi:hypothetical protein
MKKISWLLAAACLLQTTGSAQSLRRATEVPWIMSRGYEYNGLNNSSDYSHKKNILYVSETEAVIPYYIPEKGRLVMGIKNEMNGLAKVNNKGVVKWQVELHNGAILGIARFNGNILVVSVPDWTGVKARLTPNKPMKATVYNTANGKKLLEKDILLTPNMFAQVHVHNNAAGEFQQLVVRHTKMPTSGGSIFTMNKHEKQMRQTESIQLYTLSKELELKQTAAISITDPEQQYLASITDEAGNLDVAWATATAIVLERYTPGATTPAVKLATPIEWNDKWMTEIVLAANPANTDQVVVAMRYKNGLYHIKTVQYNLATQKMVVYDEEIDKAYRNTIEREAEVPEGHSREMTKKIRFSELKPRDIVFYGSQAIVAKQVNGVYEDPNRSHARFVADAIITVFNADGRVQKHYLLSKNADIGESFGLNLVGDTLQMVTANDVRLTATALLYGAINLKEEKWQKLVSLPNGVKNAELTSASTLWFTTGAVIQTWETAGAFSPDPITALKVMTHK